MRRPRIGITTGAGIAVLEYQQAVEAAGGEAVVIVPDAARSAADTLKAVDGMIFSGGNDIDPEHYGAPPHAEAELASPERDAFELTLVREAFAQRIPTLAICRGLQIVNVAFGGSLHQHVPDLVGTEIPHSLVAGGKTVRGPLGNHCVDVMPGTRLARLVGESIVTGSRHHQSVDRVANGFRAVARIPDGIIEALEPPKDAGFFLAVQWHPESTLDEPATMSRPLFRALVDAAAKNDARA